MSDNAFHELFAGWFADLFHPIPPQSLLPLLDCFLVEGSKILFRFALAVAEAFLSDATDDLDSESIETFFADKLRALTPNQVSALLSKSFGIHLSRDDFAKFDAVHRQNRPCHWLC